MVVVHDHHAVDMTDGQGLYPQLKCWTVRMEIHNQSHYPIKHIHVIWCLRKAERFPRELPCKVSLQAQGWSNDKGCLEFCIGSWLVEALSWKLFWGFHGAYF